MTTAFTTKQPYEAFSISFDFTSVLGAESIASATITATDVSTQADVSAVILDASKQMNNETIVYAYVRAGTSGHNYLITCRIVGSLGSQYELEGILPVSETGTAEEAGTGENLESLIAAIRGIIQDAAFTDPMLTSKINESVSSIAAGIRMPDGTTSPPLPDLFKTGTVTTTSVAYVSMPLDYQRNVTNIVDASGNKIAPPRGSDYYAFKIFMNQIGNLNLTEAGSVYRVCVRGRKLYYQGIPSTATAIGVHYYRKPTPMATGADEPDGIPEHLQMRLIKHWVCKEIYGEAIEDGQDNSGVGVKYHTGKFYEAMMELIDFIGIDGEPLYYGDDGGGDLGACD